MSESQMKVHQILIFLDILMALSKKLGESLRSVSGQIPEFSHVASCVGDTGKLWDPPGDAPQALSEFFQQALVLGQ